MSGYDTYPQASDVQKLLAATGLPVPATLDYDGAAQAAASEWERRVGWWPFLSTGAIETRFFDPPGAGPSAGRTTSYRGGRILDLGSGLLELPYNGVAIGVIQPLGNPIEPGTIGTVLTLNLQYFLRPDNAQARKLAWTRIEFLTPIRGLPQSIAVSGVWGRHRKVPAEVWRAILEKAASLLAPEIELSLNRGRVRVKNEHVDYTFASAGAVSPLAPQVAQWEKNFDRQAGSPNYKRVTV